jgi:hypothetical protein
VLRCKSGFARACGADQHHEREIRDCQMHVNTPICVDAPSSGSVSPISSNVTL